jgi:hypothetical protein
MDVGIHNFLFTREEADSNEKDTIFAELRVYLYYCSGLIY